MFDFTKSRTVPSLNVAIRLYDEFLANPILKRPEPSHCVGLPRPGRFVFCGHQIRKVQTEVGTLVSVTLNMTVDTGTTDLTVLVPRVNLDDAPGATADIRTESTKTKHRLFYNRDLLKGQLDNYSIVRLVGIASLVAF